VSVRVDWARVLRRDRTEAERVLWGLLRSRRLGGAKFRRQHPVGPFIADFACVAAMLVVEADGGQHVDSETDVRRTEWLRGRGWRVMRFWNNQILESPEGVLEAIARELGRPSPSQR
jgi:very-short-patch-repair endonuclease